MLNDPVRAVRIKAARILVIVPADRLRPEQRALLSRVTSEYVQTQRANADRPEALVEFAPERPRAKGLREQIRSAR